MVLGSLVQIFTLVGFAVLLVKSHSSGKHLLLTAGTWFIAVCGWLFMSPGMWGWKLRAPNRTLRALVLALVYGSIWTYQLFMYGWLVPLGVGIYRVVRS